MASPAAFTSVRFTNYKALSDFTLDLKHLNILVGPNNCGKSTVLGAFRALAVAIRRARSRSPERIHGPNGPTSGYHVPTADLGVSVENVHTNLHDVDTRIVFSLSNRTQLELFFPRDGGCNMICRNEGVQPRSPSGFKNVCPLIVDHIPVLGPVEHNEDLVSPETVRQGATTHRASRHFRSFWHYNEDDFAHFADLLRKTWPGMDVQKPVVTRSPKAVVHMLCTEHRMTRELCWAGFGFQVWCQILTHLTRAQHSNLIVVDEPEIYLHPELQRQLVHLLRELGPDILMATHSTEIVSEADPSEILLIDRSFTRAKRLVAADRVQDALDILGSSQNITLTQLARNKRILFVEGNDFTVLRQFARKLDLRDLANGTGLTIVPIEGFANWEKIKTVAWGFQKALSANLALGVVLDRDYRCGEEIDQVVTELSPHLSFVHVFRRKELENYLLHPEALERALQRQQEDRVRRGEDRRQSTESVVQILTAICDDLKEDVRGQYQARNYQFLRSSGADFATVNTRVSHWFNDQCRSLQRHIELSPGKMVLSRLNAKLQRDCAVSLTASKIVSAMHVAEIPHEIKDLIERLDEFRKGKDFRLRSPASAQATGA